MGERERGRSRAGLTERDRFWLRHIEASARSRTPATIYVAEHGLSLGAFYEAKRRLVRRGAVSPAPRRGRVSFAAVEVVPEVRVGEAGPFRLRLASGAVLEWASAPGIEVLGALIEHVDTPR